VVRIPAADPEVRRSSGSGTGSNAEPKLGTELDISCVVTVVIKKLYDTYNPTFIFSYA
jgi:hypothetical protein